MKRKLVGLNKEIGDEYMRQLREVSRLAYRGKITGGYDLEKGEVEIVCPSNLGRSERLLGVILQKMNHSYPGLVVIRPEEEIYKQIDEALDNERKA